MSIDHWKELGFLHHYITTKHTTAVHLHRFVCEHGGCFGCAQDQLRSKKAPQCTSRFFVKFFFLQPADRDKQFCQVSWTNRWGVFETEAGNCNTCGAISVSISEPASSTLIDLSTFSHTVSCGRSLYRPILRRKSHQYTGSHVNAEGQFCHSPRLVEGREHEMHMCSPVK